MIERCGYVPNPAGNIPEKHFITGEAIIQMDYIYRPLTIRLAVPADALDMAEALMRSWEVMAERPLLRGVWRGLWGYSGKRRGSHRLRAEYAEKT